MVSQRPVLRIASIAGAALVMLATSGLGAANAGGREVIATDGTAFPSPSVNIVLSGAAHEAQFAVAFGSQRGIAVGSGGSIVMSGDAGANWRHEDSPTTLALLGVDVSDTAAIAVGQQGVILVRRSTDAKWRVTKSGTDNRLFAVSLNSRGMAIAAGAFGTVIASRDGGETWQSVAPIWKNFAADGIDPHVYAAHISSDGVMMLAGEFGLILRSATGGAAWELLHKGDASLFAMQLRDDGVGYAVGQSGTILRSLDRGSTWNVLPSVSKANLLGVYSASDGGVVATGMRDMLISGDGGDTWRHVATGDTTTSWYAGVAQAGPTAPIVMVGHAGQIAHVGR
jgi:photosystem II stability/assembly factor-like uncharacterized protein